MPLHGQLGAAVPKKPAAVLLNLIPRRKKKTVRRLLHQGLYQRQEIKLQNKIKPRFPQILNKCTDSLPEGVGLEVEVVLVDPEGPHGLLHGVVDPVDGPVVVPLLAAAQVSGIRA